MASQSQFEEKAYIALLGLAEYFRSTKNIKKSIQCLDAVCCLHFFLPIPYTTPIEWENILHYLQLFAFPALSRKVEARTHMQIGQILFAYTNNQDLAHKHLDKAWTLSSTVQSGFDDIKYDSAYTLSKLYSQQNQSNNAKHILRKALEMSQNNIYWHSRCLFTIAVSWIG